MYQSIILHNLPSRYKAVCEILRIAVNAGSAGAVQCRNVEWFVYLYANSKTFKCTNVGRSACRFYIACKATARGCKQNLGATLKLRIDNNGSTIA